MNPPNQKQLHKAAKRNGSKFIYPCEKPIPVGMILDDDDEDGINSNPIRSLFGKDEDEGITGEALLSMTEDEERDLIPFNATSKMYEQQTYVNRASNRLMVRPKSKSSKNNIICSQSPKF